MNHEERVAALLSEAARWRLVQVLLERPRPGWSREVTALAAEIQDSRLEVAAGAIGDVNEGRYLAVFGPGGAVSPREVAYRPMGDPGGILAELRGIYEAFGYSPHTEDPPDHVAVQAGFAGFMRLKQAYALASGHTAHERTTRKALETCLEEHLGGFVSELAGKLRNADLAHMGQAAAVLEELCPDVPSSRVPLASLTPTPGALPCDEQDAFTCDARCAGERDA